MRTQLLPVIFLCLAGCAAARPVAETQPIRTAPYPPLRSNETVEERILVAPLLMPVNPLSGRLYEWNVQNAAELQRLLAIPLPLPAPSNRTLSIEQVVEAATQRTLIWIPPEAAPIAVEKDPQGDYQETFERIKRSGEPTVGRWLRGLLTGSTESGYAKQRMKSSVDSRRNPNDDDDSVDKQRFLDAMLLTDRHIIIIAVPR